MKKYQINIETERLILRNIIQEDKSFLMNLWTDPDVTEFMGGPRNIETLDPAIEDSINNPFEEEYDLWVLTDKFTGNPVGHCGLLDKEIEGKDEIEIIYVIDRNYQGKGYASEIAEGILDYAFNKNLSSVTALIKPANNISEKVAVKIGMKMEKKNYQS